MDTLNDIETALEALPKQLDAKRAEIAKEEFNVEKTQRLVGEEKFGLINLANSYRKQVEELREGIKDEPFERLEPNAAHVDAWQNWDRLDADKRQEALHRISKGDDPLLAEALVIKPGLLSSLGEANQKLVLAAVYGGDRVKQIEDNMAAREKANRTLRAITRTIEELRR